MKRTTESWSNALFSKRHKGDDESPLTEAEQDFESFSAHFAVPHAIGRVLQMRQAMNVRQLLLRSARDAWLSNDRCGRRSHGCTPRCRSVLTAWCLLTTLTADPPSLIILPFLSNPPSPFPATYLASVPAEEHGLQAVHEAPEDVHAQDVRLCSLVLRLSCFSPRLPARLPPLAASPTTRASHSQFFNRARPLCGTAHWPASSPGLCRHGPRE